MERPALGTLRPGDPVVLIDPDHHCYHPGDGTYPASVVKVARVWVTVRRDVGGAEIKLRMDSQSQETGYGHGGYRFVTPEQRAYDERMRAARQTLTDAGVRLDYHSPFSSDDAATLALAERVAQIVAARVVTETTEAEGSS